jgi:RNA polymerase sigma-70 factor (ECF subfamily)
MSSGQLQEDFAEPAHEGPLRDDNGAACVSLARFDSAPCVCATKSSSGANAGSASTLLLLAADGMCVDSPEDRWVDAAREGDRQAFAELVRFYWERIYRWLHGLTHSAHVAEDLTQEVFLRAWTHLPDFTRGHFRAWLFRIARNCWIDRQRTHDSTGPLPDVMSGPAAEPLTQLLEAENAELLQHACRQLPEHFRAAFLLWAREDLSAAELGAILDVTEETARWRIFKARQLLLAALGPHLDRKRP